MASILAEKCAVDASAGIATIVVRGDSHDDLAQASVRPMALQHAASLGLSRPGLDSTSGVYPVDENGVSDDDVVFGRRPVAGYQQDFKIRGGL
jgi:hypothetical protein